MAFLVQKTKICARFSSKRKGKLVKRLVYVIYMYMLGAFITFIIYVGWPSRVYYIYVVYKLVLVFRVKIWHN